MLLAQFIVSTTADFPQDTATSDDGTLRWAILASNATTTNNTIDFQLPGGVQTITVKTTLPPITDALEIDGTSATGFSNSPLIQITGGGSILGPGLTVNAPNSELLDLDITSFVGDGVDVNSNNSQVNGCYIGVDPTGTVAESNTNDGILDTGRADEIGSVATNPNVISANGGDDIELNSTGFGDNVVFNSYIGTNAAGTAALFGKVLTTAGIAISDSDNQIGGVIGGGAGSHTLAVGNLISGNTYGIEITQGGNTNTIEGNFIGTDVTGKLAVPNTSVGIYDSSGADNTIGGLIDAVSNLIDSNGTGTNGGNSGGDGILVDGTNSVDNIIEGNYIGVGADGTTKLGNAGWGINITNADFNIIGNDIGGSNDLGNVIEYNNTLGGAGGVVINTGTNDGILSNSIYDNLPSGSGNGPGISLVNGGNTGVKAPTLTSVQSGAGQTRIIGTFSGLRNTQYTVQFFYSSTPNPSGFGDGENYLSDADYPITTNNVGVATINTTISPNVPVGFYVTATVTQNLGVINNTSAFSNAFQATLAQVADLQVTTAVPSNAPELDQPYKYTLTVTNNGPNATTGVVLTDTLPTNSSVVSVSGGTVISGVLTDNLGSLAAGASDTVTIVVKPTGTGTFTNVAVVSGPDLDPNATNNTSTTTSKAVPDADLSVSLTPSATVAPVGSPLTYLLAISNFGPSTATNTVATVQFPADFGNVLVSPDQGSYTIGTGNLVTIDTGILPASTTSDVTITVTPSQVESAMATAAVTSPLADPNTANNTTSATVTIANAADLGVTISATPNPVLIGQDLIYTVVLTNNGPSAASEPVVTDALPAGVTYDSNHSSAGPNGTIALAGGTVVADMNALLPGASDTITIAVIPAASGLVTNTVNVGDPTITNPIEIDPVPSNNSATVQVAVSPADLSVTVINPNDPLAIGQLDVFEVQVMNSGPTAATNVLLADQFAGNGGQILNVSSGQYSGNNFSENLGTLAANQSVDVYLIYNPLKSGLLTDTATVSGDQYDPDTTNNTSSSTNVVSPAALKVTITPSLNQVLVDNLLSFAVTVTNNGPTAATNVLFNASLPADALLEGLAPTQGKVAANAAYTAVSGNLGTLAAGASATVYYVMVPLSVGPATTTATVTSDAYTTNVANETATSSPTVFNTPGTIQFTSTLGYVSDLAGSVTSVLVRTGGSEGTVSVTYTTTDYTAVSGVNYVGGTGTVTFQPGQFYASITLPILNSGLLDGNHGFFISISSPTNGGSIGPNAADGVVILNTNRDLVPPDVSGLLAIPNGNTITGFAVTFDKAMNPTNASLLSNYYVFESSNGSTTGGTPVPLAAAEYNASNNTVILVPTRPLPANTFYSIILNGTVGNSLIDTSGNLLYGSFGAHSNYVAYYGQGTSLTYDDSRNNKVTLNLTGGGIMGIFRSANGDATLINLYSIVPHATKLSGNVTKLNKFGTGYTVVGAINGFGEFGYVNSTLTTPQFYVGSAPVSALSVGAGVPVSLTVSAESVVTKVTTKSTTPKGPKSHKK